MKRSSAEQLLVLVGLVLAGVGLRIYFQELPNFAPVAALALFAGGCFPSRRLAMLVPLGVMAASDLLIGTYQPLLMASNYALLAAPVCLRHLLPPSPSVATASRSVRTDRLRAATTLSLLTVGASLLFFVGSNLMTWVVTPWYDRTLAGLVECYWNAIPFFRYTLLGDLFFGTLLFGGQAMVRSAMQLGAVWSVAPVASRMRTGRGSRRS